MSIKKRITQLEQLPAKRQPFLLTMLTDEQLDRIIAGENPLTVCPELAHYPASKGIGRVTFLSELSEAKLDAILADDWMRYEHQETD